MPNLEVHRITISQGSSLVVRRLCVIAFVLSALLSTATAGSGDLPRKPSGQTIDIELSNKNIGSVPAEAYLVEQSVYVNPLEVFEFIDVRATLNGDETIISGFFRSEDNEFVINAECYSITLAGKNHLFHATDFRQLAQGIFVRIEILDSVFELRCVYDPYRLHVEITSSQPLPAELKIADERRRLNLKVNGNIDHPVPDRIFTLPRSWVSGGAIDWALGGEYDGFKPKANYHLLFGSQFLGGDLDALIQGELDQRLDWAQIPWRWRFPIQNTSLVRTLLVGRRAAFSNMLLPDSMVGMQISNAYAGGFRSSYSTYTISDQTEPDWMVELYVNEQLVSFVRADQTGFFQFVIPLPYGSTDIRLRFLGPYGEERVQDMAFRIPYTFLPPGEVEYNLSAGTSVANPSIANSLAKLDLKFGISTVATLGGGLRYLGVANATNYHPYLSGSFRISRDVLASAEYYHRDGVRASVGVSSTTGFALSAEYASSFSGYLTTATEATVSNQRSLRIGTPLPWQFGSFRASIVDNPTSSTRGDLQLGGVLTMNLLRSVLALSANTFFTREQFRLKKASNVNGEISFSLPSIWGVQIRPNATVDYSAVRAIAVGVSASHHFRKLGALNLSITQYLQPRALFAQASFGFDLSYAQMGLAVGGGSHSELLVGSNMQGAVVFDPLASRVVATNRSEVRRAAFDLVPFLDANSNGTKEDDEPIVRNVKLETSPAPAFQQSDGTISILGLEPYVPYYIKTTMKSVEDASLVPRFESFELTLPANGFTRIPLPILRVAQIEGFVSRMTINGAKPIAGIRVKIQHRETDDSSFVAPKEDLLTYSNGEFYYLGLVPGKYRICPDPIQLELLHLRATPPHIDITVHNLEDGDLKQDLNFLLDQ